MRYQATYFIHYFYAATGSWTILSNPAYLLNKNPPDSVAMTRIFLRKHTEAGLSASLFSCVPGELNPNHMWLWALHKICRLKQQQITDQQNKAAGVTGSDTEVNQWEATYDLQARHITRQIPLSRQGVYIAFSSTAYSFKKQVCISTFTGLNSQTGCEKKRLNGHGKMNSSWVALEQGK